MTPPWQALRLRETRFYAIKKLREALLPGAFF